MIVFDKPGRMAGRTRVVLLGSLLATAPTLLGQTPERPDAGGMAVEVVKPVRRALVRELNMPGTLIADEYVDLFAKTSGYVKHIKVDIGDRVRKGDLLVELSVPEMKDKLHRTQALLKANEAKVRAFTAKVAQMERMVETAQAEVQRFEARHVLDKIILKRKHELRAGNAIPEQELDEARSAHAITEAEVRMAKAGVAGTRAEQRVTEADVEVAEAEVLVARANVARLNTLIDYASVTAPFDGVITVRNVDHGSFVRSAAEGGANPLLGIARTDKIRVVLEIPESDTRYVRAGTEAEIDIKAIGGHSFAGRVTRTAWVLNPATRTMRAEIDLDNISGQFSPGMYAQVAVKLETKANAMLVPAKAIRLDQSQTVVLVSANGVAESRPVDVGYDDGVWAEVLSGLDEQELVITSTSGAVAPGVAVSPVLVGS